MSNPEEKDNLGQDFREEHGKRLEYEKRYTIQEVSEIIGLSQQQLRRYEEKLELEIPRNTLDHRFYTDKEVQIYTKIKSLLDQGLSLDVIKNQIMPRRMGEELEEQTEQAMMMSSIKTMTGEELLRLFSEHSRGILANVIKEEMQSIRDSIREEVRETLKEELKESVIEEIQKGNEQRQAENKKLLDMIEKMRRDQEDQQQKKGFFGRMFGK